MPCALSVAYRGDGGHHGMKAHHMPINVFAHEYALCQLNTHSNNRFRVPCIAGHQICPL